MRQRLSKLSQIDLAQIPTDRVGLGSKVVVECQETLVLETYKLVFGEDDLEDGNVTMASPIGRALAGKAVGEHVILQLPARTRRMRVVELVTIHVASNGDV